jgi:hypothetical protein
MNPWFGHDSEYDGDVVLHKGVIRPPIGDVDRAKPGRTHSGYMKETR